VWSYGEKQSQEGSPAWQKAIASEPLGHQQMNSTDATRQAYSVCAFVFDSVSLKKNRPDMLFLLDTPCLQAGPQQMLNTSQHHIFTSPSYAVAVAVTTVPADPVTAVVAVTVPTLTDLGRKGIMMHMSGIAMIQNLAASES
jgi:hypothetical protein